MPWASARNSAIVSRSSVAELPELGQHGRIGGAHLQRAEPDARARIRCWAPSCRSRSIRARSPLGAHDPLLCLADQLQRGELHLGQLQGPRAGPQRASTRLRCARSSSAR
jgi:hypothetical protein